MPDRRPTRPVLRFVAAALAVALVPAAEASIVGSPHITASTTLGQYAGFAIGQMVDGFSGDSPFNGYASGFGATTGRITLTFDQLYDLDSFVLWNDINVSNEGVRSFMLSFEDENGTSLGSTGTFSAVSQLASQTYAFAHVGGVKRVQLDVLSSSLQIEIREVAFNGGASGGTSAVPAPGTALLAGAALCALGAGRLRRRPR